MKGAWGSKRILEVTPFTPPVCAARKPGRIICSRKRSQHDRKWDESRRLFGYKFIIKK
jgi:hypothetical protein